VTRGSRSTPRESRRGLTFAPGQAVRSPPISRTRLLGGLAGTILGLLAIGAAPAMASSGAGSGVVLSVAPVPTAAHPKAGTPTITWSTGNGSPGELTVMPAEAREILVAANAEGSVAAPWLVAGEVYVFRLYSTGSGASCWRA
jgi:hypothetical protein